jgi:hypothetical protein
MRVEGFSTTPVPPRASRKERLGRFSRGIAANRSKTKPFQDATSVAAMRIVCLPGKARNAVAMAAIAANTQANRKT